MLIFYSENSAENACPPEHWEVGWKSVQLHSAQSWALDHSLAVSKLGTWGDGYWQQRHSVLTIIIFETSPSSQTLEVRIVSAQHGFIPTCLNGHSCVHTVIDPYLMPWNLLTKKKWHSIKREPSVVWEQDVSGCQYRWVIITGFILCTSFGGAYRGQGGEFQSIGKKCLCGQLSIRGPPPYSPKQILGFLVPRCYTHTHTHWWWLQACRPVYTVHPNTGRTGSLHLTSMPILPLCGSTVIFACNKALPWV